MTRGPAPPAPGSRRDARPSPGRRLPRRPVAFLLPLLVAGLPLPALGQEAPPDSILPAEQADTTVAVDSARVRVLDLLERLAAPPLPDSLRELVDSARRPPPRIPAGQDTVLNALLSLPGVPGQPVRRDRARVRGRRAGGSVRRTGSARAILPGRRRAHGARGRFVHHDERFHQPDLDRGFLGVHRERRRATHQHVDDLQPRRPARHRLRRAHPVRGIRGLDRERGPAFGDSGDRPWSARRVHLVRPGASPLPLRHQPDQDRGRQHAGGAFGKALLRRRSRLLVPLHVPEHRARTRQRHSYPALQL